MKLYDLAMSGNCYKIRLFLSVLGIEYETIPVDMKAGDNKSSEFLAMNPNGLVPVLVDGSTTIYDSAAILSYLAKKYADESWFPTDPLQCSKVVRWLAFEQSEGRYGLARARVMTLKVASPLASLGTIDESKTVATWGLQTLEQQLAKTKWLAEGVAASIADIACYPYTALCYQGGLSLEAYPAIQRWIKDVEQLEGYVALPG